MDLGRSDPNPGWARLFKGWAGVDEALTRHPTSSVALAARAGDGRRRRRRRRCPMKMAVICDGNLREDLEFFSDLCDEGGGGEEDGDEGSR